jgi:hypothetical protein
LADRDDDPQPALPRLQSLQFIYRRLLDPESGVGYAVELTTNLVNNTAWRAVQPGDGISKVSSSPNPRRHHRRRPHVHPARHDQPVAPAAAEGRPDTIKNGAAAS